MMINEENGLRHSQEETRENREEPKLK